MTMKQLIPMLNVSDLEASLSFYRQALSFELICPEQALSEWRWCAIRSGDTRLMLSETGSTPALAKECNPREDSSWPTIFYFYPDDVEALYRHLQGLGLKVTPLEVTFYGMKEFSIRDPDGHLLSFGEESDQQPEQPEQD